MKRVTLTVALFFIVPTLMLGQVADHPPRGQGYVFVSAATRGMTPAVGFGGEAYADGVGVGAEIGVGDLSFPLKSSNTVLGLGSLDLSYHFFPKKRASKAAPFVTGGYTLYFGHNRGDGGLTTSGFNVGGGVDFLSTRHLGTRFEVRYFGHGGRILHYTHPDINQLSFVAFRIGLTFR